MDGDELAVRLRQQSCRRQVVLVALTAMSGEESRQRIRAASFDLHLVKPVDPFKLVEVVNTLFESFGRQWSERADSRHA